MRMRYVQPKIIGTFAAITSIKSAKNPISQEVTLGSFTDAVGYRADE